MAFDPKQNIIDSMRILFPDPCVTEVRIVKAGRLGTVSGYFELPEHTDEMVEAVAEHSGDYNVYWTINPVHPDLLARSYNRTKPYAMDTTNDRAVMKRNWLAIDIDPDRFSGISSSDEEKGEAKKVMYAIVGWLKQLGWPEPVKASSGNGYHLLYRIDLPNTDDSERLVQSVLEALAVVFDNPSAHVDRTLYNASRILKAYGTVACKGESVPTRPHRYARMTVPTEPVQLVTHEQLSAVVATLPVKEKISSASSSVGRWTKPLVEAAFRTASVRVRPAMSFKGGFKWQHDCWSNPDHKSPDAFTALDANGWVSYKCSHNSCGAGMNSREWIKTLEDKCGLRIVKPAYVGKTIEELRKKFDFEECE